MKILAFSDWRVQSIGELIKYIRSLNKKPDLIIYAGDDIHRFNTASETGGSNNHFEEIAQLSKYGLLAVAGNADPPSTTFAICGRNVRNVHKEPFIIGEYAFIGLEGATKGPGFLLYSEEEVESHLNCKLSEVPNRKLIIVSHTPPYGILDTGIRYAIDHIGSRALRKFLDDHYDRVSLLICGHSHSQGGKTAKHKGVTIVNCASHDDPGTPGRVALIDISQTVKTKWHHIRELSLTNVPLVGNVRAEALKKMGVTNIKQLAELSVSDELANKYDCFQGGSLELIVNYAKAIVSGKPIVTGRHPFFEYSPYSKDVYFFFDAEYDPDGEGTIFLLGLMTPDGEIKQLFADTPADEERILTEFKEWLTKETPKLVSYGFKGADAPQLVKAFKKYNMSTPNIEVFDLYFDCINTQRKEEQFIYLPMPGSMSLKDVASFLGYKRPRNLKIHNGFEAMLQYRRFVETKDEQIKRNLMYYNKSDLESIKFLFQIIDRLFFDS